MAQADFARVAAVSAAETPSQGRIFISEQLSNAIAEMDEEGALAMAWIKANPLTRYATPEATPSAPDGNVNAHQDSAYGKFCLRT